MVDTVGDEDESVDTMGALWLTADGRLLSVLHKGGA
jgi:hypothetical protein